MLGFVVLSTRSTGRVIVISRRTPRHRADVPVATNLPSARAIARNSTGPFFAIAALVSGAAVVPAVFDPKPTAVVEPMAKDTAPKDSLYTSALAPATESSVDVDPSEPTPEDETREMAAGQRAYAKRIADETAATAAVAAEKSAKEAVTRRASAPQPVSRARHRASLPVDAAAKTTNIVAPTPNRTSAVAAVPAVAVETKPRASSSSVVDIARHYLGVPYVLGGESPGGFDCSGLTQYVYNQVGVRLPRTAHEQAKVGTATTNPKPGDLVFYGATAYHVGIYVGDGQMIAAPKPGDHVKVQSVDWASHYYRQVV